MTGRVTEMRSWLRNLWVNSSPSKLFQAEEAILRKIPGPAVLSHQVAIGNDQYINTIAMGNEHHPVLLLVHGYGAGVGLWAKNLRELSSYYRVFAIDLLGFGRSSRPDPDFSRSNLEKAQSFFLDSLEAFRQAVGIDRPFILLGHSFGGYVSTLYALRNPQHLSGLILASPLGMTTKTPEHRSQAKESKMINAIDFLWEKDTTLQDIVKSLGPLGANFLSSIVHRRFASLPTSDREDLSNYLFHLWVASGSGEYALTTLFDSSLTARQPLLPRLNELKCPTSFMYGQWDWMDWRQVDGLLRASSNPNLKEIIFLPNCGHQMCLENPEEFNRVVLELGRARYGRPNASR